ncbi:MAG: glycosyltransferase family 2 protein [Candidatus Gastranaerophilaceae bacterium]
MDVSVILVSYNTKELTRDCLKSLYQYTYDIEFEVFVVDNNSQDGSCEMIEQEFQQVKLIKNPDNKGFGSANNVAIRQSCGKYIFCLNTDTVLLNNSIKQFFDFMEKEENQKVGACGCQLLDKDMKIQHSYGCLPRISRIILTLFGIKQLFPKWYNKKYFVSVSNRKNEKTTINYLKREGSKFHVTRGKE